MKKYVALFLIAAAPFSLTNCDPEEVCKNVYLADLLMNNFSSIFDKEEDGKNYYDISQSILNSVGDLLDCKDNIKTAGKSKFKEQILFSTNPNFTDSKVVDEVEYDINEIEVDKSASIKENISFNVDGYYIVRSTADARNDVEERDELNNEDENSPVSLVGEVGHRIIKVENTKNTPTIINGKEIYLTRESVLITYE
jgi:hypothetical protein